MKAQAVCAGVGLYWPVRAIVKLKHYVSWLLRLAIIKNKVVCTYNDINYIRMKIIIKTYPFVIILQFTLLCILRLFTPTLYGGMGCCLSSLPNFEFSDICW